MLIETLAAALEREHHEIDAGIDAFVAGIADGREDPEPLVRAVAALRRHIYLEEEFLFPPLRDAGLLAPVFVMLREHGQIWGTLDAIHLELMADAAGESLRKLCRELAVQLQHHNMKEERIIYPQADLMLSAPADAELRTFLASGQLPDGWICQRA